MPRAARRFILNAHGLTLPDFDFVKVHEFDARVTTYTDFGSAVCANPQDSARICNGETNVGGYPTLPHEIEIQESQRPRQFVDLLPEMTFSNFTVHDLFSEVQASVTECHGDGNLSPSLVPDADFNRPLLQGAQGSGVYGILLSQVLAILKKQTAHRPFHLHIIACLNSYIPPPENIIGSRASVYNYLNKGFVWVDNVDPRVGADGNLGWARLGGAMVDGTLNDTNLHTNLPEHRYGIVPTGPFFASFVEDDHIPDEDWPPHVGGHKKKKSRKSKRKKKLLLPASGRRKTRKAQLPTSRRKKKSHRKKY